MAEVGVLNLTIKDNSQQAVTGLGNLADALRGVRDAVKDAQIGKIATQIKRIAEAVNNNLNESTISKLHGLTSALGELKGLGNININLKSANKITKAMDSIRTAMQGANTQNGIADGFGFAASKIQTATSAVNEFNRSVHETNQLMQNTNWSGGFAQFQEMLNGWLQMKSARALPGHVGSTELSTDVETGWTYWKDGAIEVEGTVTDAMDNIAGSIEGTQQLLLGSGPTTYVFSSIEEAARVMGISVEEATRRASAAYASLYTQINTPLSFANYTMDMSALDAEFNRMAQSEDTATSATERLKGALETLKSIGKSVGHGIGSVWNELSNGVRRLHMPLSGVVSQFARLAKMRMMRAVLRMIASGLKEGVENVYNYSNAVGTSFAPALDNAKSIMEQFKNSVGAAAAPALQALIPLFYSIASAAIDALNAVNQLFALLGGATSWTKAVLPTSKAFDNTKKAAKGAGGAVKELLGDFDELNIIASEGGGGGTAADVGTAIEDMFQQMSEFDQKWKDITDGIKDNFEDIKRAAMDVGIAILAWKLSKAFTGALGSLMSLVAAGAIMDLTWRITAITDRMYLKTGDPGWLVADAITNAVGATLAGSLVGSVLGTGWGLVTAGFTLLISGAISYGIAIANADNENAELLKKIGLIKAGIGAALIGAGFYVATGSIWAAAGAMLFSVPLFYAVATIVATIETAKNEQRIAQDFFKNSGKGGISVKKLFEEVNKEFERLAAPYSVTMDIFSKHQDAITTMKQQLDILTGLNSVVTSGQALTEGQAKNFRDAWDLVFEAFRNANDIEWDTIMSGFNAAMQVSNEELREQAKQQRIIALQIKGGLDEIEAQLVDRMNELVDKIMTNQATEEEVQEYLQKMEGFGLIADQTIQTFKDTLENVKLIDFSEEDNAVQAAIDFIKNTTQSYKDTIDAIDLGLKDQLASIDAQKERINNLVRAGVLDSGTAEEWKKNLDEMAQTFKNAAEEKKASVSKAMTESFKMILNTAKEGIKKYISEDGGIDFEGASTYVDSVIGPIIQELRDSGADVETIVNEVFNFGELLLDSLEIGSGDYNELVSFLVGELGGIVKEAGGKVNLDSSFLRNLFNLEDWDMGVDYKRDIAKKITEAFGIDSAIASLKDYYNLDISELLDVFGWEGLESEQRQNILTALENIFGPDAVKEVMKKYGIDITKYLANGLSNKSEIISALSSIEETLEKGGLSSQYILDNWDLVAPAINGKNPEDAVKLIEEIVQAAGENTRYILENWDLVAPTIEEYGLDNSISMIKDVATTSGLDIQTVIENWNLIAPIVEDNGITESLADIKTVADKSGVDLRTILEHWNLIAPLVDEYGITASMNSIKRLAQATGVDVDTILDNWDLYAPFVTTQGLENSLNYLTKLLQTTGHDSEYILQHWNLVAPTVNHLGFDNTIAAIKQISQTSGVDIKSIVANWNLIAPLINEKNIDKSIDEIGTAIKDGGTDWQNKLKNMKLEAGKVTMSSDFLSTATTELENGISSLQVIGKSKKIIIPVGVQSDGSSVHTAVHDTKEGGKYISLDTTPGYVLAEGGFPLKGSIFVANEAGPEMVGKIGSRSAVANTEQIVSGIAIGVSEANSEQNALLKEQNTLLRQILAKDNSVRIGASAQLGRVAKQSLEMYSTVGG